MTYIYRHRVAAAGVVLVAVMTLPRAAVQDSPSRGRLYHDSRAELALARVRGDASVTLVIAAVDNATAGVARVVAAAGGTVRVRNDEIGYVRAEVPIDQVDAVTEDQAVAAAAIDFSANAPLAVLAGPRPRALAPPSSNAEAVGAEAWQEKAAPPAAQWSDAPFRDPYSPLKDLGAADMRRAHPTYDGRGITIGHVERVVDLLVPELEAAYTLDGRVTPKLVDVRTTTDPDHSHGPDGRRIWIKLDAEVVAVSGRFAAGDAAYAAPRDGRFRFGMFDGGGVCGMLPTGAAPPPSACRFAVLWDPQAREVWVDTTRDRSFTDERALADFAVRRDIGTLGRDEPETPQREEVAFTVQTDPAKGAVAINVGSGGHATSVASSAAGSRGARGRFEGVAPGARLINFDYGSECIAGVVEAFIAAFSDPRVDVVLFEQNSLILKGYRLNDGRHPSTIITARLIDKYKKPYTVTANNPPGLSATSEHGNARWGFAVGSFETKESYRVNDGYLVAHEDNLHHDSGAGGPSGTGAIKPDIVVPSGYLSSFMPIRNYTPAYSGQKGLYRFPPGYGIFGGTSQAAPTMAGALAVLMSAAKQEGVPYDAERIWRAVTGSARHLPHLQTHLQGHGAVDVQAALALLKAYAKNASRTAIESRASVRTAYSAGLRPRHQGVGLWEQEGWRAGQKEQRTITFTRTAGPAEPMTFTVSWQGNDGTFASPSTLTLPLRTPVGLEVTVAPQSSGAHSALVTLDHPSIPGHAHRTMATVVAADAFDAKTQFAISKKDVVARPGPFTSYYMEVPQAAEAMVVRATGGSLWLLDPINRGSNSPGANPRIVPLPRAGIWEATTEIQSDPLELAWMVPPGQLAPPVPTTLDATVLGAGIEAPALVNLTLRTSRTIEVNVENRFAAFQGGLTTTAIVAARTSQERLVPGAQRVFDLHVPAGSPLLLAEVTGASALDAELDLYLFDCTAKRCVAAASTLGLGSSPRVRRVQPKPGLWKIVVDASRVPAGGITFDYTDAVGDPALGMVAVTDTSVPRAVGARWTGNANVWLARQPTLGRDPRAALIVSATEGVTTLPIAVRLMPIVTK